MLNWVKNKAKLAFNIHYNTWERFQNQNMFLTEQSMLNTQETSTEPIKLLLYNEENEEYTIDAPLEMTMAKVKMLAISHFYGPAEAATAGSSEGHFEAVASNYRLIRVQDCRTLADENSVSVEELINSDELLLISCAVGPSERLHKSILGTDTTTTEGEISQERINECTSHLPQLPRAYQGQTSQTDPDFKMALRQILTSLISVSVHLIAAAESSEARRGFEAVFAQLRRRHQRPRSSRLRGATPVAPAGQLRQLVEMGFDEERASVALQMRRNVVEAMELLLEESRSGDQDSDKEKQDIFSSPFSNESDEAPLPSEIIRRFERFAEKWFVPDERALQNLISQGYGKDLAREALRIACNNEKIATEFLEGNCGVHRSLDRNSAVVAAVLESPVVQVALSKPKTLFALVVLSESPTNVNVWLSDCETHPLVSQVLRVYHAEKHKLGAETSEPMEIDERAQ